MMLDFHQKRKVRSLMYNRYTIGALSLIVLVVLHSTWVVWQKKNESENMKNVSLAHVAELVSRNDDLKSKIVKLDTNSGVEEEIRSKFSVAKENENMVVVVPDAPEIVSTSTQKVGFWQKMKNMFFGS